MSEPIPWTPRPYQLTSLEWLIEKPHAGLLLDPGLGKTSTTLAAIQFLKEGGHVHHVLVVAPLRVAKTVWPVESKKWLDFNDMTVCSLCEMGTDERRQLLGRKYDVYVINPESLQRILEIDPWSILDLDMLVVDESTKFKDTQTQRFKALKKHLHKFKRRCILTGTPAPNGLADLFGQMYVCDLGEALGKFITHFRQRYMFLSHDGFSWKLVPGVEQDIYDRIRPKMLRLMAVDHLEMPELINNYIEVDLPKDALKVYKEMERNFLVEIRDQTVVAFNSAALGVKCRQISNGFIYNDAHEALPIHGQKLDALLELVDEMQGRPLLLCYEFIEDARAIKSILPGAVNVSEAKNTLKVVEDFNAGKIPALMGHPKSMGHGLNLQEICKDICWFGITWDLELYQQAIARVWRQGQPSPVVTNHLIVAKDTLDLEVVKRLADKDATQNRLNQALKILADRYAPR